MCLPAAALPIIAAATTAAGTLVQGYSAMQQGNFEAGISKQNAALEREAAENSLKSGEGERRDFWRKVGQVKGQQTAAMAANGIDLGFGTATRIADDTNAGAAEDSQNLYQNIDQRTRGFIINSWNDKMQAKAQKAQGRAAMVGSAFSAAGSLLSGFSQMQKMKAKMGTSSASSGD